MVRFVAHISMPVAQLGNLWRGEPWDFGKNPAKVSGYKILFPGQFSRLARRPTGDFAGCPRLNVEVRPTKLKVDRRFRGYFAMTNPFTM
jgi:hypothetical protein